MYYVTNLLDVQALLRPRSAIGSDANDFTVTAGVQVRAPEPMMLLRINRFQIALAEVFDLVSPMSRAVGDHHVLGTVLWDHCDTGLHCAYSMAGLIRMASY
jgi:hypothetical protein